MNTLPFQHHSTRLKSAILCLLAPMFLFGCGSGSGSGSDNDSKPAATIKQSKVKSYKQESTLKGRVTYKDEIIESGEVVVSNEKGDVIAKGELTGQQYKVKIPAGTKLPLIITFIPDPDSPTTEKLKTVAIHNSMTKYDVSEITTAITKRAKAMGGYTHKNMIMAADDRVGVPDSNKTSTGFRGDPTKQYGGWH